MRILPSGSRFNILSENQNKWCLHLFYQHWVAIMATATLMHLRQNTDSCCYRFSSTHEEPRPTSSSSRGITKESLWTLSSRAASALTTSRCKEPLIHWASFTGWRKPKVYMWSGFAPSRDLDAARWWSLISSAGNKSQDRLMCGHRETTRCFSDESRPWSWWGH